MIIGKRAYYYKSIWKVELTAIKDAGRRSVDTIVRALIILASLWLCTAMLEVLRFSSRIEESDSLRSTSPFRESRVVS
jgi:hypothetical protein